MSITSEQLDEIERLAEAATPGPWVWRGPSSDDPADLWTADGKDAIVCVQTTNADIKFIRAMREHALPLVKALREAREAVKEAQDEAKLAECQLDEIVELAGSGGDGSAFGSVESLLCDLKERTEERDEARSEAAEIRKKRNADLLALEKAMDASAEGSWMARALDAERERDEARAEVERLKEEVRVAWAQKADSDVWRNRYRAELRNAEALLAALKEEHRPADEVRAQLLAEIEAHAETKAEVERLREIVAVNDQRLATMHDEKQQEIDRLRKLLNPAPKPDLGAPLMRLMREDQRKAIYAQAWQEALLAGNTREQAHSIARAAAEAALKESDR